MKKSPTQQQKYVICHGDAKWSIVTKAELNSRVNAGEFTKKDKAFILGRSVKLNQINSKSNNSD